MRSRSVRRALLVLFGLLPLARCGAGGGGTGPRDVTVPIGSTAAVDGGVYSDGSVFTAGEAIRAGDTPANGSVRGALRFLLGALPPNAVIRSAVLRVHQSAVIGNPYVGMGGLVAEPVDLGVALDAADFASPALPGNFPVSMDAILGFKFVDVTAAVQDAVFTARPSLDFRLRFTTPSNLDGVDDHVEIDDAEDQFGSGNAPQLEVTYIDF